MRHGFKNKKLNRTTSHRKAMFENMAVSLLEHEQIKTTLPKAKALRPVIEKIITLARKPGIPTLRRLKAILNNNDVIVQKLIADIVVRTANRPGGYTRIYKMGHRYGDMAPMAMIELVDREAVSAEPEKKKAKKTKAAVEAVTEK